MAWRKWLVRSLVFSILGGIAVAAWLYQRLTDPAVIRQQVIAQLEHHFPGALVSVDSARLRLLGGIAVQDIRLVRRDDPEKVVFFYVPSAVFYHDKEQLVDGHQLAIRKIELNRPRLRVVRSSQGKWNVQGVISPPSPEEPIPSLVLQHATILIEDGLAGSTAPPLEWNNVNITVVNNPLLYGNFRATAGSELFGKLQVNGSWQRVTEEVTLSLQADDIPLGPEMLQRLSVYQPSLAGHTQQVDGILQVRAEMHYQPDQPQPWHHDVHAKLTNGRLRHPQIPVALEQLEGSAHCLDGHLTVDELTAQADTARVKMSLETLGREVEPTADGDWTDQLKHLDLHVEHLVVTPELFEHVAPKVQKIQHDFAPVGPVSLRFQIDHHSGHWRKHASLSLEGLAVVYDKFRYPLERVQGSVDHLQTNERVDLMKVDLVGYSADQPITIKGEIDGDGATAGVRLDITGENLPLDKKLEGALPSELQKIAQSFQPRGLGNIVAKVTKDKGSTEFKSRYIAFFHHAAVRYDVFPYPLENVSGILDVQPDHWEFREFRGDHKDGEIRACGRNHADPQGDRLEIEIIGRNVRLDEELEAALDPKLQHSWKMFAPAGRMDFFAHVDHQHGQAPEVDVTVQPRGVNLQPTFFPYALTDLSGTIRYAKNRLTLSQMRARHDDSVISLDNGIVYCKPEGGFWADMSDLRGHPIVPDAEFHRALPPALKAICATLQLKDPLELTTRLTLDLPPESEQGMILYWDGSIVMRQGTLHPGVQLEKVSGQLASRGRFEGHQLDSVEGNIQLSEATLFNQPLHDVHVPFEVSRDAPNVLKVKGMQARIFGGDIYGPMRIEFGDSPHFELNLTASRIKLEELGRHNFQQNTEFQGLATGRLYLKGDGGDTRNLEGNGSLEVPSGRMYDLPLLLDLLKVLGLRPPDHTAFEEAYATFSIRGPRVLVHRLDMYGNAISLSGNGEMNLDGSAIDLDFYAVWGRIVQMLPPMLNKIPPTISQYLLKIKMRGKIGDVRCLKEPVPILVEPMKLLLDRLSGRKGRQRGEE